MFKSYEEKQSRKIKANESEDVAHLATVSDVASEQLLSGILKENNIPYMRKARSRAGGVIVGIAESEIDIYVSRPCLEKARELYEAYFCSNGVELLNNDK